MSGEAGLAAQRGQWDPALGLQDTSVLLLTKNHPISGVFPVFHEKSLKVSCLQVGWKTDHIKHRLWCFNPPRFSNDG